MKPIKRATLRFITHAFLMAFTSVALMACQPSTHQTPVTADTATYYLVRHAEKVLGVENPPLNPDGLKRAEVLKTELAAVSFTEIFSTDLTRTLDTAKPIADAQNLNIALYDPRDLEGFANVLLKRDGQFLIVGHSNTTPQLAELLGGSGGTPIYEPTEYDRLYKITRIGTAIESEILRFGTLYIPKVSTEPTSQAEP